MKAIFSKTSRWDTVQKLLMVSFTVLFLTTAGILFGEVAEKLNWNETVYILLTIELTAFGVCFAWVKIEHSKTLLMISAIKIENEENTDSLQNKLIQLSNKEKTVLALILKGKTNKEISTELFIEQSTLKSHINRIYKKLNIKNRKQLFLMEP